MKQLNTFHLLVSVIILIGYSITLCACSTDNNSATFSGRLIDVEGKPISGHVVTMYPVEMSDSGSVIYRSLQSIVLSPGFLSARTDRNGFFRFKGDLTPGMIRFGLMPSKVLKGLRNQEIKEYDFKTGYNLISVKIGSMTFYRDRHGPGSRTFSLQPERRVQNAVITARSMMWIEGRIVFADQKPLSNVPATFKIHSRRRDKSNVSSYNDRIHKTDAKGNFSLSLFYHSESRLYMVSVEYQGLSATSMEFLIKGGGRYDGLILKLNGDSKEIPDDPKPPELIHSSIKLSPEQWIVNPANGHAYAKILCESFEAAKSQAKSESAYLVAISDEAEQKWLSSVFGYRLYWIGLHKHDTENKWIWDDGEPLTYTNWGTEDRFPIDILAEGEKQAVVMTFVEGEWHAIAPGDLFWDVTKMAILERENFNKGSPSEDR